MDAASAPHADRPRRKTPRLSPAEWALVKFLSTKRRTRRTTGAGDDGPPTAPAEMSHTRMPDKATDLSGGAFSIPDNDPKLSLEFFTLYSAAAAAALEDGRTLSLLEYGDKQATPLKIDIDTRTAPDDGGGAGDLGGGPAATNATKAGGAAPPPPPNRIRPAGHPARHITRDHIVALVRAVARAFDRLLEAESVRADDNLGTDPRTALVFQRAHPSRAEGGVVKDGFHVVFPDLVCCPLVQNIVRGDVVLELERASPSSSSSSSASAGAGAGSGAADPHLVAFMGPMQNPAADVYDPAVTKGKNPYPMYGSDKPGKPFSNRYTLTHVLRVGGGGTGHAVTAGDPRAYVAEIVAASNPPASLRSPLAREVFAMSTHLRMRSYHGPRPVALMRADYAETEWFKPIQAGGFLPVRRVTALDLPDGSAHSRRTSAAEFDYVARLVGECLSVDRAAREDDWFRVGLALCNIAMRAADEAERADRLRENLALWVAFSRRPAQYAHSAERNCTNKWRYLLNMARHATGPSLGLSSLEDAAQRDAPARFREVQAEHMHHRLVESLQTRDNQVAHIVLRLGGTDQRFRCTEPHKGSWCYWDEPTGLWMTVKANPLKLHVPDRVYPLMEKVIEDEFRRKEAACGGDMAMLNGAAKTRKEQLRRISTLLDNGKMSAVGNVLAARLYDSTFNDRLDQDLDLVSIGNGEVFDLARGDVRAARPSDMVSLSTGQPFSPPSMAGGEYHLEHPDVLAVLGFLHDIFPHQETFDYVVKWLASHFEGHVGDELFHVLIGTGANGKSKLQTLMSMVYGSLYATTSIKTFTGQRAEAAGTTSHYEHIRNKRSVWVQEPEEGEKMNAGVLKELTGGDRINTRALYGECSEFKPQAKFVLVANHRPDVPAEDEAIWRRLRCIPFLVSFKTDPDPDNKFERKRDITLEQNFPAWAPALHWYLLGPGYRKYKAEGILSDAQIPPDIYKETEAYRAANDEIVDFIQANMDAADDVDANRASMVDDGDDGDDDALRVEVDTKELTVRFTRFLENQRRRSKHHRVSGNEARITKLFSKRKAFREPVALGNGRLGWTKWLWKVDATTMVSDWGM